VGTGLGKAVGLTVGWAVGVTVGFTVGLSVGADVTAHEAVAKMLSYPREPYGETQRPGPIPHHEFLLQQLEQAAPHSRVKHSVGVYPPSQEHCPT